MKKILPWTISLVLACWIACIYLSAPDEPAPLNLDCNNLCNDYSQDSVYPLVSGDLLQAMADTFVATRTSTPSGILNGKDANSVWFALDDLKKFIWKIENTVCKQDCKDKLNLGIRIYYARYPSIDAANIKRYPDLINVPDSFSNMQTVFMVPTFDQHNSTEHFDFYLDSNFIDKEGCRPIVIPQDGDIGQVSALCAGKNHGTLCPPVCGRVVFGR